MALCLKCLFKALVCPKSKGLSKWEMFGDQTFYRLATLFSTVWLACLIVFGRVLKNVKTIKHLIKQLKTFLLFLCLMGDVL